MKEFKSYTMHNLKKRDAINIIEGILLMGFSRDDYRVVYFAEDQSELKITNERLHWVIKSMSKLRRQKNKGK